MLIKTVPNHCHKFHSFVYTKVSLVKKDQNEVIIGDIAARKSGKKLCSKCKRSCKGYDLMSFRLFQFVPLWGIMVYFRYGRRRVQCPIHGIVAEYLPWAEEKSHLTTTFKIYLAQ